MDTFFIYLRKSLVAITIGLFAFTATYVPNNWNQVEEVHAGPYGLEITQLVNVAWNNITAIATSYLQLKESSLDGVAWMIIKGLLHTIVQELVDWIKSGFQGKPQFIQNIRAYLTEVADQVAGDFISSAVGEFICSPFQLDIKIALEIEYAEIISQRGERPYGSCKLSDIVDNLDDFLSGARGSFSDRGGWEQWFEVTAQPMKYTEYGSFLSARAGMRAAITGAEGEELTGIDWGDGFLSLRFCQDEGGGGDIPYSTADRDKDCKVGTPGKIIVDSLTRSMDTGREAAVVADEIDEIIGALIGLLINEAIKGVRGILDM